VVINLSEPVKDEKPIWQLAFRSFFLGATLFGIVSMVIWLGFWGGLAVPMNPMVGAMEWHGHEMLFGFGVAIIFGFVLTAVQAWTGIPGVKNKKLILIWVCWLLARIGFLIPDSALFWPAAIFDLIFESLALYFLVRSLVIRKQMNNIRMAMVPLLMIIANMVFYIAVATENVELQKNSLMAVVWLFGLIMSVIGGRVIPFFTSIKLGTPQAVRHKWLEISCPVILVVLAVNAFGKWLPTDVLSIVAVIAALLHIVRWSTWQKVALWCHPLLWSLHLSYLFMPIFFFAVAIQDTLQISSSDLLHLLTIGSISGMILAMISRVSLGHTGRNLQTLPVVNVAFVLINLAAVLRFIPVFLPELRLEMYSLSGWTWVVSFAIFVICYWNVLTSPRVDGVKG